jgi:hypothetical protein
VVGQFRTDEKGEYKTTFEAELPPADKEKWISIQTYHGPAEAEHWMRFDDFRIAYIRDGDAPSGSAKRD